VHFYVFRAIPTPAVFKENAMKIQIVDLNELARTSK
jgi:hypothetical protein